MANDPSADKSSFNIDNCIDQQHNRQVFGTKVDSGGSKRVVGRTA